MALCHVYVMNVKEKIIALIAGHGKGVVGKQSPLINGVIDAADEFVENGRVREWKYTRVIVREIDNLLKDMGYTSIIVVPEDNDISLAERVKRVNSLCEKYGSSNVILLEVHANANGNGEKWDSANGFEAFSTVGNTNSDLLAECIYNHAIQNFKGHNIRMDNTDGDKDKEKDFYVIKNVSCPAVLTENFFYTNKSDLKYMISQDGIHKVVRTHVEGAIDYLQRKDGK